ncbi:MAG: UDP-glucose/GDP-mannose dehydrogenase family protein [Myxococcales bacterium]|nr:UDP-glucose/GDP-mannose dehydrogenase family protein [Myxococcales bacterium]MDD9965060.1 UDP-glucose/GDP-mannose dehydrogenase family protein [Myxococcales bacterium]
MKVCVIGAGYVGLVTGTGFAETGNDVVCADLAEDKVAALHRGEVPIFEPGLEPLIKNNVEGGRLKFTTDVDAAIADAEVIFVAVGTPPRADGAANLMAVDAVAETVAKATRRECVLVMKSTVPVGTNARVRRILEHAGTTKVHVVSNPEFLKEGDAVNDFMRPDRIVIGCDPEDEFARDLMRRLYHPLTLSSERIVWMAPASAELTKYVANTMLAMRISFMNEIAALCEAVNADVHDVRVGVGTDTRIGPKFLYAGPGYGGSCFPKDVTALIHVAREHNVPLDLATATDAVNQRQKGVMLRKLKQAFEGDLRGKRIAVWGIAFKPRTDDIRESPAITLIEGLLAEGAKVSAHDPEACENARQRLGDAVDVVDNQYDALTGASALVLVTEWRQYQNPDFERIKDALETPVLLDARNIWDTYGLGKQGFTYLGIGVRGS